ncbi:MAG: ABC transporter ATP-binding protein [Acidothermus cellulolyticus]|nr:ABC transporter ATP-binding protein [Acidothermus cellulolyticus]
MSQLPAEEVGLVEFERDQATRLEDVRPVLEVRHLSKSYGDPPHAVTVLKDINLTIGENEFVTIIGSSGCGKTTLLKVMAGLLSPSDGEVYLDGTRVRRPMPHKTAMVFQEDALLPWFKVRENVALGLAAQGVPRRERRERVMKSLATVGLVHYADAYPHQLSGGMRQRVALARGLVMEPRLLMLDEPFAALDEQTRNLMGAELRELHRRVGGAMVMITHSLTEAVLLSDRVVALSARPGRVRRIVDIPLGPDRDVSMVDRADFVELRHLLWSELREDWIRSMDRTTV